MRVVLLGAPGAGKGTLCMRIVEKYGMEHLSSGDILRRERAQGTELGKKAQSYMDAGGLVPDEIIIKMMIQAIKRTENRGYVLDGFPRTVVQAKELDKALQKTGEKVDVIINLTVNDDVIVSRMSGRVSCPRCGSVYHIQNLKPKTEGVCDNDGEKLVQRPDDSPEVVANRLKTYYKQTRPVVDYYKRNKVVYDIDTSRDVSEVTAEVFSRLEKVSVS